MIAVDAIPGDSSWPALRRRHVVDFTVTQPGGADQGLTSGRGADVSIEISGSYRALHEAIRATAYNSRVVVSGFPQGEAAGLFLGEEFHHNRIAVVCSQISGVNPSWTTAGTSPRLERTVVELAAAGASTSRRSSRTRSPRRRGRKPSPCSPSRRKMPCRWSSTSRAAPDDAPGLPGAPAPR